MAPGMREVAEKAGVSIATVSNVLNRPQVVTEPTQRRVRQAMDELGFVRNGSARQLRAGKSEVVCVTVPGFTPFYDELIRGVEERAAEHGLVVFACATSDDPVKEESYLRVFMEQRVRGIFLTRASEVFQKPGHSVPKHVPVIFVDLESGLLDHCSSSVDDLHGSVQAVRHLHELGHRRIAWVGPPDVPQLRKRAEGVRSAAAELGMDLIEIATNPITNVQAGQIAALDLHEIGTPTAVICGNDSMAVGMEMQLAALGYSVPDDVSIVGYDDIEFAAAAIVPLTTVARHPAAIGSSAIDLLLEGCGATDHVHKQVLLPSELVVRASTGSPRASG